MIKRAHETDACSAFKPSAAVAESAETSTDKSDTGETD